MIAIIIPPTNITPFSLSLKNEVIDINAGTKISSRYASTNKHPTSPRTRMSDFNSLKTLMLVNSLAKGAI